MIFILSMKEWEKSKKKFVEPKDYLILDATDDDDSKMTSYTNMVCMDNFAVPMKLLKLAGDDSFEDAIDLDKIEELEENFFKSAKFRTSVLATLSTFLNSNKEGDSNGTINVFIVLRNKAFKFYRKKFRREFIKVFPDAEHLIFVAESYKDIKDKLTKEISSGEIDLLQKELKKKEKTIEDDVKKLKKKKKKNKKKKKDGWGFGITSF